MTVKGIFFFVTFVMDQMRLEQIKFKERLQKYIYLMCTCSIFEK